MDISGPCDEAEHANDPRCTGAPSDAAWTTRAPGSENSGRDDDADDDPGPGSAHSAAVATTAAVTVTTTTAATAAVATTTDQPGAPARLPFTPWRAGAPS